MHYKIFGQICKRTIKEYHSKNPRACVWFTGHSLGGAMASLATGCYLKEGYIGAKKPYLVTFGQPRFGDQACCEFINSRSHVTRFIHGIDPIPKVPVEGMGYKHIGQVKYLTKEKSSQCELIGQEEYERRTQISDLEDPERILNWVIVRVCR